MTGKPKISDEEREKRNDEIVRLYTVDRMSTSDIASQFNLSQSTVLLVLNTRSVKKRSYRLDILGKRFGRLTVIGEPLETQKSEKNYTKSKWLCLCDCGNETTVAVASLQNGDSKSCGCFKTDVLADLHKTHGLTSNGVNTTEYNIYHAAKKRAKNKDLEFTLELSDIVIPEFCPVFPDIKLEANTHAVAYNSPTLDRLIPERGYTKENVRVISHKANTMKQTATVEELRMLADWLERELEVSSGQP